MNSTMLEAANFMRSENTDVKEVSAFWFSHPRSERRLNSPDPQDQIDHEHLDRWFSGPYASFKYRLNDAGILCTSW